MTLEERERHWYIAGWPLQATPQDVSDALDCAAWADAAGDHGLNTPAELTAVLEAGALATTQAEAFKEALHSLAASGAVSDECAAVISEWLKAPEASDFDRMLDTLTP